eukprot:SAG31_NODE_7302_length_1726_cov_13.320000_2_plen_134_part_00
MTDNTLGRQNVAYAFGLMERTRSLVERDGRVSIDDAISAQLLQVTRQALLPLVFAACIFGVWLGGTPGTEGGGIPMMFSFMATAIVGQVEAFVGPKDMKARLLGALGQLARTVFGFIVFFVSFCLLWFWAGGL